MKSRIKKIARGNRSAQSTFYDEYSALVMGICSRYIREKDQAFDVFQEAFIKIFQSIHQVKDPKAMGGWIRRITINTALDHLKSWRYSEPIDHQSHELSDQFYADLLDKMSVEAILEIVNELPEGYRLIFNLYVIDGYSHREIAEKLSISESTSRSQLTHARKMLKKRLHHLGITHYEQVI